VSFLHNYSVRLCVRPPPDTKLRFSSVSMFPLYILLCFQFLSYDYFKTFLFVFLSMFLNPYSHLVYNLKFHIFSHYSFLHVICAKQLFLCRTFSHSVYSAHNTATCNFVLISGFHRVFLQSFTFICRLIYSITRWFKYDRD